MCYGKIYCGEKIKLRRKYHFEEEDEILNENLNESLPYLQ